MLADYGASKHIGKGLRAGLDFEPWPYVDLDGGEVLTPTAVSVAPAARPCDPGRRRPGRYASPRALFSFGFFDRAAYPIDESQIDQAADLRTARDIAEGGHGAAAQPGPRAAARRPAGPVAGGDRRRRRPLRQRRRLVEHRAVLLHHAARGDRGRAGSGVDVRFDDGTDPARAAGLARGADAAVVVVADRPARGSTSRACALTAARRTPCAATG